MFTLQVNSDGTSDILEVDDPALTTASPTIDDYRTAVQAHLDATAHARLYTDGNSLATYAASTNPEWAAEAAAFVAWRDAVWSQVYVLWAAPPDPAPTIEDLIGGLPQMVWPGVE